jgi:hypothetical protein
VTEDEHREKFVTVIGQVLYFRLNEPILWVNALEFMDPKPADLAANDKEREELNKSLAVLSEALGAVPQDSNQTGAAGQQPKYDEYGIATLDEIVNYFTRCRAAVFRAHLSLIAKHAVDERPELIKIEPAKIPPLRELMKDLFWEEAEVAYIRLASYWDRVGQLLDFMYFNVRQYDREGFGAVLDRIHSNFYQIYPELRISDAYKRLKAFRQSEQPEGFQWLARRRNLLVHSLRLRKLFDDNDNAIFHFAFNHLEEKYRDKLQPRDPVDENKCLHTHLAKCAKLLPDVIELSKLALAIELHASVHRRKTDQEWIPTH